MDEKTYSKFRRKPLDSAIFFCKIDERGRISIPVCIRKALRLKYQSSLVVKIERGDKL